MRPPDPSTTRRSLLALLAIATVILSPSAAAQGRAGDVRGRVTRSESGTPIAGARVAVSSPARAVLTSERGTYVLRDLPAGRYEVTVTALGRQPRRDSVAVQTGQTTTLDVAMARGR